MSFADFIYEVNHKLMGDFVSMSNDEISRYMKMEKLLENKISRRFKFRRLEKKGRMVIATVQGDIHDIGKNIVRTVLENYGYEVIDLGRDVPPEVIRDTALRENIRLVGLSALMTTTLPAMEATVRLLQALTEPPVIMVGGAVVTPDYAAGLGVLYARDAQDSARIARSVLG